MSRNNITTELHMSMVGEDDFVKVSSLPKGILKSYLNEVVRLTELNIAKIGLMIMGMSDETKPSHAIINDEVDMSIVKLKYEITKEYIDNDKEMTRELEVLVNFIIAGTNTSIYKSENLPTDSEVLMKALSMSYFDTLIIGDFTDDEILDSLKRDVFEADDEDDGDEVRDLWLDGIEEEEDDDDDEFTSIPGYEGINEY